MTSTKDKLTLKTVQDLSTLLCGGVEPAQAAALARGIRDNYYLAKILVALSPQDLEVTLRSFEVLANDGGSSGEVSGKNQDQNSGKENETLDLDTIMAMGDPDMDLVLPPITTICPEKDLRPTFTPGTIKDAIMEHIFLKGDLGASLAGIHELGFRKNTVRQYLADLENRGFITSEVVDGDLHYWVDPKWNETTVNNVSFEEATKMFLSKPCRFTREDLAKVVPSERVSQYINVWVSRGWAVTARGDTFLPAPSQCSGYVLEGLARDNQNGSSQEIAKLASSLGADQECLDKVLEYLRDNGQVAFC